MCKIPTAQLSNQSRHIQDKRRAYLLLFYSPEKAAKDQADMNDYLSSLYNDLVENSSKDYRAKDYDKFFTRIFRRLTWEKLLLCKGLRGISRFTGMATLPLQVVSRCESVLRSG